MKILGVDFDRLDLKSFKIKDFLNGCSASMLSGLTNDTKTITLIRQREAICQACPLGQKNETSCYRDMQISELQVKRKEIEKEFLNSDLNFKQKEALIVQKLNAWIENETPKRLHTISVHTNKPILGCGCIRKCKQANENNHCPAGKW